MDQNRLTCRSCGQHFETKSDLQDHEKICQGQGIGEGGQQQTGNRTRTAGGGGGEGEQSGK